MPVPDQVTQLVDRFRSNRDAYKNPHYNETQVRREFIDPLFQALGWDVSNEQGYAEAYKDVIHEDAVKIGGATKAPDYCFRIGGARKFFLEAKKPAVGIKSDPEPAYQLRRYAWSAKLPLSILTDFEEFAVYDCRLRPHRTDKAAKGRTLYLTYDQYPEKWDELAALFSKDAVLKGSFDKYAVLGRGKRGTTEVDAEFLKEIERWRDLLARNFALRNQNLTQRDLNFAVQRTIDRMVFLRICEDRRIEQYGTLLGLINGPRIYARLFERFRLADERYNSGLFHFRSEKGRPEAPDELTPTLELDDKVLKDILGHLYYPESPYEFSVLPADILGQVYEQFLGKVIRLTKGHRAVVDEKPEVRKAGGVYYTPTYIVDYIVQHTVGKLVEERTPQQVGALTATFQPSKAKGARALKILDPACGSGSFLLGAYQFLLDWYRDQYIASGPETHARGANPRLFQHASGEWRLTTAERKRILLAHIHGVDIDSQAVETTKLSLLLKVLEGEDAESVGQNLKLWHERALPDLGDNIKCGNSLIGPDFYQYHQLDLLDEEERLRINVFDWNAEFRDIMSTGGFDAVIGNPPYGAALDDRTRSYLRLAWSCYAAYEDSYVAFLEAGLRILCPSGRLGMIIPSAVFGGPAYTLVRKFLLTKARWDIAVLLPYDIFGAAYVDTAIVCLQRGADEVGDHTVQTFCYPKRERIVAMEGLSYDLVSQANWLRDPEHRIVLDFQATSLAQVLRTRFARTMGNVADIKRGVLPTPGALSECQTDRCTHPYFEGNVYRYDLQERLDRFAAFDNTMKERPREFKWFTGDRILLRRLVNRRFRLMATIAHDVFITNKNLYVILGRSAPLHLVLAVLNSRLVSYLYIKQVTQAAKDDFGQVTITGVRSLPWPNEIGRHEQDRMVTLAESMLALHQQLQAAKTAHERTAIQRQIDATDGQIDQLVYELYGLTDAEIRIVEEATQR